MYGSLNQFLLMKTLFWKDGTDTDNADLFYKENQSVIHNNTKCRPTLCVGLSLLYIILYMLQMTKSSLYSPDMLLNFVQGVLVVYCFHDEGR